jgi:N-acyl-L-homoserine lactone synthetase
MHQMHSLKSLEFAPRLRDSMFKDRAKQFSERLKWDLKVDEEGREFDEYDNNLARYLIRTNENGEHLASVRINFGSVNCMLRDHFAGNFPSVGKFDNKFIEITRFCITPALTREHSYLVSSELLWNVFMDCLNQGTIHTIVGLCFSPMLRVYKKIGAKPYSISRGQIDSSLLLAKWDVSKERMLQILQQKELNQHI